MTRTNEGAAPAEAKAAWSVVVVYEDAATRGRAVSFCDQLVSRFWEGFAFDVAWWAFAQLEEAITAKEAAEKAAHADLLVFAANAEGDFPQTVKAWVEAWLSQRGEREGLLVGLLEPAAGTTGWEGPKHHYLRKAAHHGALDYLTEVPEDISHSFPDSLDSYTERADQITHLLDNILHQQTPPPALLT